LLVAKARSHPQGPGDWLSSHGLLTREMWRYFGAIRGEMNPRITVLKPIWERVVRRKLPGGMHYGHVAAMIEAAFEVNDLAMRQFEALAEEPNQDVTAVAQAVLGTLRRVLADHYPDYHQAGGERPDGAPPVGARRFLIDPLDGMRNFAHHRFEFCIVIACQEYDGSRWRTTDGVISHPPTGRIYWAERGRGAFVIERNDRERRTVIRPLGGGTGAPLGHLIDVSARFLGVEGQADLFRELLARGAKLRYSGSVALLLAQMAGQGGAGAVVTAEDHDVEAGLLIAQEAGSWTTQVGFDLAGQQRVATVVGVDQRIHDELLAVVVALLGRIAGGHAMLGRTPPARPD
jgi:fructose-1,6-bisphosphatase/inositol monophosphatase family enzyme